MLLFAHAMFGARKENFKCSKCKASVYDARHCKKWFKEKRLSFYHTLRLFRSRVLLRLCGKRLQTLFMQIEGGSSFLWS